jgi:hypothetical protein
MFRFAYFVAMSELDEIAQLKAQVEQLTAENAALREAGFRGSKAEALMALEYDRIPTFLKSQAVAWQRKIATAVMIVVPLILVAVAVFGGCMPIGPSAVGEKCRYGSGRG